MPWQGVAALGLPLLFFVAFGLTCWAWGEALLRLADRHKVENAADRWALAGALGLGVFGQGVFVLGLLDRLAAPYLISYVLLGHVLAATTGVWRHSGQVLRRAAPYAAAALPTIVLALYPPSGFDATVYHLPYAMRFLELGGVGFLPELRFPIFPQLAEMAFVPAILSVGDVGAQLCQALCLLLGGGVVYAWGKDRRDEACGRLCAALWFGLPLAVWIGAQAYVDVELALFVAAGAASIDRKRPGLAGVLLGFAAATKFLGLFFFAASVVVMIWSLRPRLRLPLTAWLLTAGLVTAGPWYLRQFLVTGNPLFPFYPGLFGDNPWSASHQVAISGIHRISSLLTLPWDGVFGRAIFHFEAPLSPWYLVLLPLLGWMLLRPRRAPGDRAVPWLLVVLAYSLFWLTTQAEIRFWLPALPLLHLPIALTLRNLLAGKRRQLTLVALLLLAPGWLYGVYKIAEVGPMPLTRESRSAYLSERVPGYKALDHFNRTAASGDGVYGLHVERLRHYARGPFVGDWFGPDRYPDIAPLAQRPGALRRYLDGRGLRYLILRTSQPGLPKLRKSRHFTVVYEDEDFVLLKVRSPYK